MTLPAVVPTVVAAMSSVENSPHLDKPVAVIPTAAEAVPSVVNLSLALSIGNGGPPA